MDPVKIGWLGSALDGPGGGYDKIHRLAFDEAVEDGLLDRPYEFVLHAEHGLPNGSAKNATDGFRFLVDEGCIGDVLDGLGWCRPRVMGTAFMGCLAGFDRCEGWGGIGQFDPRNRMTVAFHDRYVARYGEDPPMWPNAIPGLAFDTARVLVE